MFVMRSRVENLLGNVSVLNVPKVVSALFREFPHATVDDVLALLNGAKLDVGKLRFIYRTRFFVVCPSCNKSRLKLYRTEDRFACAKCQHIKTKSRWKPSPRKGITPTAYARYVRPLKILFSFDDRLENPHLTPRQRQLIERKQQKLVDALPEYTRTLAESLSQAQKSEIKNSKIFL